MEKYYTVSYEDLIYDIDCEIQVDGKWDKWKFNPESRFLTFVNLILIAKNIKNGEVRCKYLDKDDIEECGWVKRLKSDSHWQTKDAGYQLHYLEKLNTWLILEFNDEADSVFRGKLNNKAELKKIMKQIGIGSCTTL